MHLTVDLVIHHTTEITHNTMQDHPTARILQKQSKEEATEEALFEVVVHLFHEAQHGAGVRQLAALWMECKMHLSSGVPDSHKRSCPQQFTVGQKLTALFQALRAHQDFTSKLICKSKA